MTFKRTNNLIIDGNAVAYKYYFGFIKHDINEIISIALVNILYKTLYLYNKYKIDNVIIVFDCENSSWRKIYTSNKNPNKITHKAYKGGRRENLSPSEEKKLYEFDRNIQNYVSFFKKYTNLACLQGKYLEGDDLIAGYVQMFPDENHVIYSSDKDFLQLINSINGTVTLVECQKDTERSLNEWDNDPELFLFEKCFRGEPRGGDNVQSAYPRLLSKKIKLAFTDDYLRSNIMNNTFEVADIGDDDVPITYKYRTGDLHKENKLLMGLNHQPDHIKMLIRKTIEDAIDNRGSFDYVKFLQYCNRSGFDRVIQDKDNFVQLLASGYSVPLSSSFGP